MPSSPYLCICIYTCTCIYTGSNQILEAVKTQPFSDQLCSVYSQLTIATLSPAVDCGALMNPDNGRVDTPQGTTLNRLATYSCNCGYCLVGDETRTCQANGQWSGSEPTCNSLSIPTGMGVYQCPTGLISV